MQQRSARLETRAGEAMTLDVPTCEVLCVVLSGRADIAAFLVEHVGMIRGMLQAVEKKVTAARRRAMKLA